MLYSNVLMQIQKQCATSETVEHPFGTIRPESERRTS